MPELGLPPTVMPPVMGVHTDAPPHVSAHPAGDTLCEKSTPTMVVFSDTHCTDGLYTSLVPVPCNVDEIMVTWFGGLCESIYNNRPLLVPCA